MTDGNCSNNFTQAISSISTHTDGLTATKLGGSGFLLQAFVQLVQLVYLAWLSITNIGLSPVMMLQTKKTVGLFRREGPYRPWKAELSLHFIEVNITLSRTSTVLFDPVSKELYLSK
jgi:hypothetical protein